MNFKEKIYFCLFILFTVAAPAFGATSGNDYVFRHINIEDGLSQSTVYCMLQDQKGFMWFGTPNGLNRYDGYSFMVYNHNPLDSNSLSDNGITSVLEDSQGFIWEGTVEGTLNRFDRKTETFKHFQITESDESQSIRGEVYFEFPIPFSRHNDRTISTITQDSKGYIWIGTWGRGLIRLDPNTGKVKHFIYNADDEASLSSNRVKKILVNKNGEIWIGTIGGGLNKIDFSNGYDNPRFIHYRHNDKNENSISSDMVVSLCEDRDRNLWVGTYGAGLNMLSAEEKNVSPASAKFLRYKNDKNNLESLSGNIIMDILQDREGAMWIGTFGGGLDKFYPQSNKFIHFQYDKMNSNSLAKNDILSLLEDRSGILWIGTHLGKGISILEKNFTKFHQINRSNIPSEGLNDDVVWSIFQDDGKNLWIGTYKGGLNKYDKKENKFIYYKNNPANKAGINDNHIRVIKEDFNGNLWLGTYSGGLDRYNTKTGTFTKFLHVAGDTNSLGANQVQTIFIDDDSTFWVGAFGGGLNKYKYNKNRPDDVKFKKYVHSMEDPFSISDDRVYCMLKDSGGVLWIGTFGGGLNKFDPKNEKFTSYRNIPGDETSLSEDRIIDLHQGSDGYLWIGTYGGGLNKFDKITGRSIRFENKEVFDFDVVYGMLEDDHQNLWLSSDNGIFKINIITNSVTHYDLHDGLQSLEFSGGAYFKSPDGELFFGGINGLNYFYPDSVKDNMFVPPIVISSFKIFSRPVKGDINEIKLSYNQNFFSFEFSALDFTNPIDNNYAYILEGFDKEWHYTDSRNRLANYTNLAPGEYVFRVRGTNNDGLWNMKGTSVKLTILPPFWETWWFILIALATIAYLIYFLSTIRFRNLLAIEKLKTKLAADLHDNIGSGLTEIAILSELVAADPGTSTNKLQSISEKARGLVDSMSEIVWMVNPKRDSLYDLILKLKDSYSDFFSSTGISFKVSNLEKFSNVKLPMEYKQNLYLIFKEGINNSIKHSNCKRLFLEANVSGDTLELSLKDDGIGINENEIKYGNGIRNIKDRAKSIGGTVEWNSVNGAGTIIKFVGKINSLNKIRFLFSRN